MSKNVPKSKYEVYLEDNKQPRVENFDILGFWKENRFRFPVLSQMARDVLAFPYRLLHLNLHLVLGGECLMHIVVHLSQKQLKLLFA